MKISFLALAFSFITFLTTAQEKNLQYYYAQAVEARQAHNYSLFYEMTVEAGKLHPYHQGVQYLRGIAAAVTNRNEEAITYLEKAILTNASFDLTVEELTSLNDREDFKRLLTLQLELRRPVIHSDTAFVLRNRSLHPESIAVYRGTLYATSVHKRKIVKINPTGKISDFTKSAQDGLTSVLAIRIDKNKKVLWAASSPMAFMENFDSAASSAVFKYNLNGKLLGKFTTASKTNTSFGDLLITKKGEAFISDSQGNIIFKVNESNKQIQPYFTSPEFWSVQGITFSEDERYMFIADYIKGIFRLDIKTKELILLDNQAESSLKAIDGLLFYKGSLIAIQNATTPMRVCRYTLTADLTAVANAETIDRAHPAFNEPTNGCIVEDELYYLANSQWNGYDKLNKIKPEAELQDIVILKSKLR